MDNKKQRCDYGIVKVVDGEFAGRFGYYDDDAIDESATNHIDLEEDLQYKAIVYFGDILINSKYYYIDYDCLTQNYSFEDLRKRNLEIDKELWQKTDYQERCELMEEKFIIESEIQRRLENYIESKFTDNKKFFLSYSSSDKQKVISVAMDLNERGIKTWMDSFDVLPGESIVSKINEAIKESDYMLLFLSNNSVESEWVQKEWETFLWDELNENKIKIIPIKLDDCKIPKILQAKKYIDFSNSYNDGLTELISTIKIFESR